MKDERSGQWEATHRAQSAEAEEVKRATKLQLKICTHCLRHSEEMKAKRPPFP